MTPSDRTFVLAVDGGNSKTRVAVADTDGTIVAACQGPPSDIYGPAPPETAIEAITTTVTAALRAASLEASALASAVFSLAGADWPEDFEFLASELSKRLALHAAPLVVNDAIGGLRSGAPQGEGIAIICGTFNAVAARRRNGQTFHCGFWPDRTGGFDLGMEALKAVYREGLDLGPRTDLTPRALALFGASAALDLMHAFTRRENRRSPWDAQQLAPILLDCADAGDAVATGIVTRAGAVLGDQGRVSAQRIGLPIDDTAVVLSGGVFRHPAVCLIDSVLRRLPGGVPVRPEAPPLAGALLLGFDAIARPMDVELLTANLARNS